VVQQRSFCLVLCCLIVILISTVATATVHLEWMSWGDQTVIDRNERIIQAYYASFPDKDIVIRNNVVGWDFYKERLPVLVAGGAATDIISSEGSFVYGQMAEWNALMDLTDLVIPYEDEFLPGALETIRVNGKVYGFPFHGWDTSPVVFINYSCQAFDEAALPYPTYNWSWDDLLGSGKKLTNPREGKWAIDFGASSHIALWQPLLYAFGGQMYAPDRSESLISSTEAANAFRFLKELDIVYGFQAPAELVNNKIGFITGQVAMTTNWSQEATKIMDYVRFGSGITILPQGPAGFGFHPPLTCHSVGIYRESEHPAEAWHFIEWMLTSPEALEAMGPTIPMVPLKSNLPILVDMIAADDAALAGWRATEAVFERLMSAPIDRVGVEYPHTIEIITSSLQEYMGGNQAIEQILENAKSQIDRLLNELK
jgi:ABC-type glycerol-3-phosphate transport system substrate-binding protein